MCAIAAKNQRYNLSLADTQRTDKHTDKQSDRQTELNLYTPYYSILNGVWKRAWKRIGTETKKSKLWKKRVILN